MNRLCLIAAFGCIVLVASCGAPAAEPLRDAYRLMAHGELEQAITTLDKCLAETPETDEELRAETTFLLARAHESLGHWDTALELYSIVTHEYSGSECFANACLALAQLRVRQGQPDKAAAALEAAVGSGLTPEHEFQARLSLAETISIPGTQVENLDRALEILKALDDEARTPIDIGRLSYALGFCYQRKGDWEQAERAYIAVDEAAPNSLWAVYARMQRIAHYRQIRLTQEVARLEKQLGQHGVSVAAMARIEPRAPDFMRILEQAPEAPAGGNQEAQLPKNSVFAFEAYKVNADQFSVSSPDRVLIGRGNVSLVHDAKAVRTTVQSTTVRIDLRRLHADFSGNVSFETTPKRPGAKSHKVTDLSQLVIDLKTGWFRFWSAESTD
jgi:tetratricopeptide (TPR) repeat protein